MLLAVPVVVFLAMTLYFWHARRNDDSKSLRALKTILSFVFAGLTTIAAAPLIYIARNNMRTRKLWAQLSRKK
ncbi:hypothetical protein [Roseovarius aestuarii]|uniref:Uncharacterized protein n=1 Tax=Roseovarius aestuarii TaxID=475083 RepID=A0A1X7BYL0_9RHOB|nr:hypothetical protein [Roseovarius aestuarii]SMC14737.1 hypothetical protein ROA7745_04607 [Roseovarius aestuarii]